VRIRTRTLIVSVCLVGGVVAFAGPVAAAESSANFKDKAAEECDKLLRDGGTADDCQKAPSPLLPSKEEILWGSAAFAVLLVAMWKWGVPAVKNMETAREDRIRNDLEGAEAGRRDAEGLKSQYEAQLADARTQASAIIDEARAQADVVKVDLIARAEADAAELRSRANDDIRLASERAMADLRQQVAVMSVELAGKIVERNLDVATQQGLIDSYISSVGSN
jgi:F-type H+-transporting ATPase subunit b